MGSNLTLITGAAGGLGKAFVQDCATRGFDMIISDLSAQALNELAREITEKWNVSILTHPCDLTSQEERQILFDRLTAEKRELFLTINVAGIEFEGEASKLTSVQATTLLRLNTEATLDISRYSASIPHKGSFYIINVASMAGFYCMPLKAFYAASKRAILQFSLALREEIRSEGGHITVLAPAGMRTKQVVIDRIESQGVMGRLTTVDFHKVVHNTVNRVFKNTPVYIPGFINQVITALARLIPETLKARLIYKRWKKTSKKLVEEIPQHS